MARNCGEPILQTWSGTRIEGPKSPAARHILQKLARQFLGPIAREAMGKNLAKFRSAGGLAIPSVQRQRCLLNNRQEREVAGLVLLRHIIEEAKSGAPLVPGIIKRICAKRKGRKGISRSGSGCPNVATGSWKSTGRRTIEKNSYTPIADHQVTRENPQTRNPNWSKGNSNWC